MNKTVDDLVSRSEAGGDAVDACNERKWAKMGCNTHRTVDPGGKYSAD